MLHPVTLRGRHVVLEPLRREHAAELWPAASERDIWRYMPLDVAEPADLARWIDDRLRAQAEGGALAFLQRDATTGEAFGTTSLFDVDLAHKRGEIGYTWVGASHRRTAAPDAPKARLRGAPSANTEAKRLLLAHAFETLGFHRVQLKTDGRNLRSQRAIERLGAVKEGVLRRHMVMPDGFVRDTVLYSVVAEEWPAVRARLDDLLRH